MEATLLEIKIEISQYVLAILLQIVTNLMTDYFSSSFDFIFSLHFSAICLNYTMIFILSSSLKLGIEVFVFKNELIIFPFVLFVDVCFLFYSLELISFKVK